VDVAVLRGGDPQLPRRGRPPRPGRYVAVQFADTTTGEPVDPDSVTDPDQRAFVAASRFLAAYVTGDKANTVAIFGALIEAEDKLGGWMLATARLVEMAAGALAGSWMPVVLDPPDDPV
jgi:hypothetical protein